MPWCISWDITCIAWLIKINHKARNLNIGFKTLWGRSISVESIGSMCRLLMAVLHSELYR
jgi:hypothetical protein